MTTATMTPQLEELVREALGQDASDLFLIPGEPPSLRLRGCIERTAANPLSDDEVRAMAEALVGRADLERIGPELAEITRSCAVSDAGSAWMSVARSQGRYTIAVGLIEIGTHGLFQWQVPQAGHWYLRQLLRPTERRGILDIGREEARNKPTLGRVGKDHGRGGRCRRTEVLAECEAARPVGVHHYRQDTAHKPGRLRSTGEHG